MDASDPALFYTGLVAELYAPLRSSASPDPEPYIRFVTKSGQPALELGCGDGEPLLDLRARGLDVEGLDSSPDMLARCRAAAAARGLSVTLHESPMEAMELVRRYRSIYLAGPTFNLIVDDDTAWRALARIRAHLEPDGSALIPLFIPEPLPASAIGVPRTHVTDDGRTMRVTVLSEDRDEGNRLQTLVLRYELEVDGDLMREDQSVGAALAHPGGVPAAAWATRGSSSATCWRATVAPLGPTTRSSRSGSGPIPPSTRRRRSGSLAAGRAGAGGRHARPRRRRSTASARRWRSWRRRTPTGSTSATSISTSRIPPARRSSVEDPEPG